MKITKIIKNLLKTELLLSIIFLLIPFILPLTSGVILGSISAYAGAINSTVYVILLTLGGYLITVDGLTDKTRRYNILLGLLLISVTAFPVMDYRYLHDIVAIAFFIGNTFILSYHSKLVPKWFKIISFILIIITVGAFLFGFVSLFIAESLGFLLMSTFMFVRYLKTWEPIN
jgi:hypothetical protein